MKTSDADRSLTAWLEAVAPPREPEHLLAEVLSRTSRTRRRPAWRIPERWLPMSTVTQPVATVRRVPWPLVAAVALLALALVAGAVLLAGSRPTRLPAPFGPAANGSIVYEQAGDLMTLDPVSGRMAVLVGGPGLDIAPEHSRDGTQLAWLHSDELVPEPERFDLRVARADGSGARSIGTFTRPGSVVWSPTGDRIAVESEIDGRSAITLVAVATGAHTVLDVGIPAMQPGFRPGAGSQLVFRGLGADGAWGLYLVGTDGSGLVPLGLDPGFRDDAEYEINRDYYFLAPAWSPDGARLAFHTLEDSPTEDPGFRIHVVAISPSGTASDEVILGSRGTVVDDKFDAAWLPDSSGIVFQQVEETVHTLVRSPVGGDDFGTELVGLRYPEVDFFDLDFMVAPDGGKALAWSHALGQAWQLDLAGGPPVLIESGGVDGATWQRLAP
jgi:hypothetical protein